MAEKKAINESKRRKSPNKRNKQSQRKWKDADVKELISLMQEETIIFSLNNAKTPKEKSACYKVVHAELNKKGIKACKCFLINFKVSFHLILHYFTSTLPTYLYARMSVVFLSFETGTIYF